MNSRLESLPLYCGMRWQTARVLLRTAVYLRLLVPSNTLARDSRGYLQLAARGKEVCQVEVAYGVTILKQRIEREEILRIVVADAREGTLPPVFGRPLRDAHDNLRVGARPISMRDEVALELSDLDDAHRIAL